MNRQKFVLKKARFSSVKDFVLDLRLGAMLSMLSVGDFMRSKLCYSASIISGLFSLLLLFGVFDARVLGLSALIIPADAIRICCLIGVAAVCGFLYWCWCLSIAFDEVLSTETDAIAEIENARM